MSGVAELVNTFVTEYKKTPAKLKVRSMAGQAAGKAASTRGAAGRRLRGCSRACCCCCCVDPQLLDAFMVYALLTAAAQVRSRRQHQHARPAPASACLCLCARCQQLLLRAQRSP